MSARGLAMIPTAVVHAFEPLAQHQAGFQSNLGQIVEGTNLGNE